MRDSILQVIERRIMLLLANRQTAACFVALFVPSYRSAGFPVEAASNNNR